MCMESMWIWFFGFGNPADIKEYGKHDNVIDSENNGKHNVEIGDVFNDDKNECHI